MASTCLRVCWEDVDNCVTSHVLGWCVCHLSFAIDLFKWVLATSGEVMGTCTGLSRYTKDPCCPRPLNGLGLLGTGDSSWAGWAVISRVVQGGVGGEGRRLDGSKDL
eukprot:3346548-Amphidinium_carterae.1